MIVGLEIGYGTVSCVRIPEWFEDDKSQPAGCVEFQVPDTRLRCCLQEPLLNGCYWAITRPACAERLGLTFTVQPHWQRRRTGLGAWGSPHVLGRAVRQHVRPLVRSCSHSWVADLITLSMERAVGILQEKRLVLESVAGLQLKQETTIGDCILATLASVDSISVSRPLGGDQDDQ